MSAHYSVKIKSNIAQEIKKIEELNRLKIRVGVIGNPKTREDGLTNAFLLLLHTFGSIVNNIPARPVLDAIEIKKEDFDKDIRLVFIELFKNKINALNTARNIGFIALHYTLMSWETKGFGRWPELKPATIKAKNSDAILIETGDLRRQMTTDVIKK